MYNQYQLQEQARQDRARQDQARRASQQYAGVPGQHRQVFNSIPQAPYLHQSPQHNLQQSPQWQNQTQYHTAQTSPQFMQTQSVMNTQSGQSWQQGWQQQGGSFPYQAQPGYHQYSNVPFAQQSPPTYNNYVQPLAQPPRHTAATLSYIDSQPSPAPPRSLLTPTVVAPTVTPAKAPHSSPARASQGTPKYVMSDTFDGEEIVVIKRRKSNDGTPVKMPVKPVKQKINTPDHKLQATHRAPSEPETVTSEVLIALGDEYLAAAYAIAPALPSDELERYQKLISTAAACYNSALNGKNDARTSARLRLKLATLIFEETSDHSLATDILSKGVVDCERARLVDLKYTLQYQALRMLDNPAAANKAVDKVIAETQTLKLRHWTIAFQLLKFSIAPRETPGDVTAAIRNLGHIEIADDVLLSVVVSCLEALLCLGNAGLTHAQQSLATARQHQLNPELQDHPQLRTLVSALTLACHITEYKADPMQTALAPMTQEQDACAKSKSWQDDGSFVVPLSYKPGSDFFDDTAGLFIQVNGRAGLVMNWLSKASMYIMGYMLSGLALLPRNGETRKSETFMKEALKINNAQTVKGPASLYTINTTRQQNQSMGIELRLLIAAVHVSRSDYKGALEILQSLNVDQQKGKIKLAGFTEQKMRYLTACCLQGLGDASKALVMYNHWLKVDFEDDYRSVVEKDLHCLAILNSIHIKADSDYSDAMASIHTYCLSHPNRSFTSAWHIIDSTALKESGMVALKKSLNLALTPAQSNRNKQMLTLIMNRLTEVFFTDIVGQQAIKSANAARTLGRQAGDSLWTAVGCGMLRDTLQKSGQLDEAAEANRNARDAVAAVPSKVRALLQLG